MEGYSQQRGASPGIGSSRRPQKVCAPSTVHARDKVFESGDATNTYSSVFQQRLRTEISEVDSPETGELSRPTFPGSTHPGPANASTNTVTFTSSVLLPNRDSQGRRTVIDLTADSPPQPQPQPRPEIIDVDALPDRPNSYFTRNEDYRLPPRRRFAGPTTPVRVENPNHNIQYNNRPYNMSRFHHEISSPILGQAARMVHEIGVGGNGNLDAGLGGGVGQSFFHILFGADTRQRFDFSINGRSIHMDDVNFHPPGPLDYRLGANGILGDTPPVEDPVRRREAEYKPPAPAKQGFTRSPTSDDVLICPSCEHELGTHSKEEGQATVWLGKCGHVSIVNSSTTRCF